VAFSVGVARQGADAGKGAGFVQAAVMAVKQVGVGREKLERVSDEITKEGVDIEVGK
jgi:hypothetical protein